MNDAMQFVVSICSGLVVVIPVVAQLIRAVKEAAQEKQWDRLMRIVVDLMITAEDRFDKGDDKKAYVMALAESAAASVGATWDSQKVSDMIDAMIAMSKVVNKEGAAA